MKRSVRSTIWLVGAVMTLAPVSLIQGAPPWAKLLPFAQVEADPKKEYWLSEENGPWMIMAASFTGEGARTQARELILELRRDFDQVAYLHRKKFDYTDAVIGLGVDRKGQPKKMRHQRSVKYTEYAVLVGDYPSVEDSRVNKTLEILKTIHPRSLDPTSRQDKTNARPFAQLRDLYHKVNPEKQSLGPMSRAFMVRNPLIPKEFFVHAGISPLILRMNSSVEFSLLDNPGKYTVQVATFKGEVFYETELKKEEVDNWWQSLIKKKEPSKLELAAEKAHILTTALRKQGIPAFEFHDREESIVTVGSFAEVGQRQAGGKLNLDRAVYQVMQRYGAQPTAPGKISGNSTSVVGMGLMPKQMAGIMFDLSPRPIQVPKKPLIR